jgi:hypothetical protein
MKHIHPLAGCLARCARCGWWWDDLPNAGELRKGTRND